MAKADLYPSGGEPSSYHISLAGHLSIDWSDWMDEVTIHNLPDGTALIVARHIDQAALHGLLKKIRNLGIPLLSILPATGIRSRNFEIE